MHNCEFLNEPTQFIEVGHGSKGILITCQLAGRTPLDNLFAHLVRRFGQ
jgi:hypothetical protein